MTEGSWPPKVMKNPKCAVVVSKNEVDRRETVWADLLCAPPQKKKRKKSRKVGNNLSDGVGDPLQLTYYLVAHFCTLACIARTMTVSFSYPIRGNIESGL
jgi:hypothetical protein